MKQPGTRWTAEQDADVLRRLDARETVASIARSYGLDPRSIRRVRDRLGRGEAVPSLPTPPRSVAPPVPLSTDQLYRRLADLCRRGPQSLEALCDALDLAPRRVRQLVTETQAAGYTVAIAGDALGWTPAAMLQGEGVVQLPTSTTGKRTQLIVASDQHCGSKHHRRELLRDVIEAGYERGARVVLCPGDTVAGIDKSGKKWHWDLSHHGLEAQLEQVYESHPVKPGLSYHFIDGNHCDSFRHATGQRTGDALVRYMRERGRADWHYYGVGGGRVWLKSQGVERPVCIHLVHPDGGTPYALSYRLQQHLQGFAPGMKPDILLAGHLHQLAYVCERGVHACLCPSFEANGSGYSNRKPRPTTLGGLLLSYELTTEGTVRGFAMEPRVYYEPEVARTWAAPDEQSAAQSGRSELDAAITTLRDALAGLGRAA